MKNSILTVFLSLLSLGLMAQTQIGMSFTDASFQEAVAQAKKENKIIFVDAYTTWCGPCKMMSAKVFTNAMVGAFYNENFINMKIDMEKGEGLGFAKKYKVKAYPTFVFIDGNGKMVHRGLGYQEVDQFLELGGSASDPNRQLGTLQRKFDSKTGRRPEVVKNYAAALKATGSGSYEDIVLEYIKMQKEDWATFETVQFLLENASTNIQSDLFKFTSDNKETLYKHADTTLVNGVIKDAIFMTYRFNKNEQVSKMLKEHFPTNAEQYMLEYELMHYMYVNRGAAGQEQFEKVAVDYLDKYEMGSWSNLNSIAWRFYTSVDDPKLLEKALSWGEKSIALDNNFFNNDTVAALYYKLGNKVKATEHANVAIQLASEAGADTIETQKLLEKIEAME